MDEFNFIRDYLAPLSGPEGLRLKDDAALFSPSPGCELVITKDAMVEAVHFPEGEYGGNVAEKLLRVNLSDLAAKGARPLGYFLSLAIPKAMTERHLKGFVTGLREVQHAYDFTLWGGDTVATSGPLVVSATFLGQVPKGEMVKRSGAKPGHDVWVTGTIGDAYLGLQNILGHKLEPAPSSDQIWTWEEAYLRPEPRLLFRSALRQYARAALDISDGFLADAGHLAQASNVGLELQLEAIPISDSTAQWIKGQADPIKAYEALLSSGDDYELLFTAAPNSRDELLSEAKRIGVLITHVGKVVESANDRAPVKLLQNGEEVQMKKTGYIHKI